MYLTDRLEDQFFMSVNDIALEESTDMPGKPLTIDEDAVSAATGKCERARCALMNDTQRALSDIGWSEPRPNTLPGDINLCLSPLLAVVVQPPSAWKAAIASKHAETLSN
jgi:hypothetical protein